MSKKNNKKLVKKAEEIIKSTYTKYRANIAYIYPNEPKAEWYLKPNVFINDLYLKATVRCRAAGISMKIISKAMNNIIFTKEFYKNILIECVENIILNSYCDKLYPTDEKYYECSPLFQNLTVLQRYTSDEYKKCIKKVKKIMKSNLHRHDVKLEERVKAFKCNWRDVFDK